MRHGGRRRSVRLVIAVALVGVLAACGGEPSRGVGTADLAAVVKRAVAGRPSYVEGDADAVYVIIPNPAADLRQILDELGFEDDAFDLMTGDTREGVEQQLSSPCCRATWRWHGDDGLLLDLSRR